jgi:mycothiol system anti-sigma-R factor
MKKKCLDAEARLYEYLDGEMGRVKRWRLSRHLRKCPPCHDGYSFESALKDKIRAGCADDVPEELWNRIRSLFRQSDVTDASAEPMAGGSDV